jgi:hypothetical protein
MTSDFRTDAAEATRIALANTGGRSVADLVDSGCVPIPGGKRLRYFMEAPSFLVIILCWLSLFAALFLGMLHVISEVLMMGMMPAGFIVSLVYRKLRSLVLQAILTGRQDSLLKTSSGLPTRPLGIEDGKTVRKVKFLTEDEGICVLDAQRQRLLIEGCSYRYVIYAKDVFLLEPMSGYALSGARLVCRMGGHQLEMVLKSAGQGPLASLMQAFAPGQLAKGLATVLNQTLFKSEVAAYRQNALPPALPPV